MRAAIIVDPQHDFITGTLGGPGRGSVLRPLLDLAYAVDLPIVSQDWHPLNHISFSDEPEFDDRSWPVHCVVGTHGAALHPELHWAAADVVRKGQNFDIEEYSAFDGATATGASLLDVLGDSIDTLYIGGFVTEWCVAATVRDALNYGFHAVVQKACCASVDAKSGRKTFAELAEEGAEVL